MLDKHRRTTKHHIQPRVLCHLTVESQRDSRCGSDDILKLRKSLGSLYHQRKIVAYLSLARSRKQSDNTALVGNALAFKEMLDRWHMSQSIVHLLHRWIADIGHLVVMLLIVCHFEGQNRVHHIDIALDGLNAKLLPSPDLGRNKVVNRYTHRLGGFGEFEIEAWIVDQNQHIRAKFAQQRLRNLQMLKQLRKFTKHFAKAHDIHLVIVQTRLNAGSLSHEITPKETELALRVVMAQRSDKSGCVQVAGRFAGYNHVFHA